MMDDFDVNYQLEHERLELHSEEEIQEVNALYVAMTRASSTIDYGKELSKWLNSKNLI